MILTALAAAALTIPPPPDWRPPRVSGPGLYCAFSFGLDLQPGETAISQWPGEVFMNDMFGTTWVETPHGRVTILENGPRTVQSGPSRAAGRVEGQDVRRYESGAYGVTVHANRNVRALTLRFAPGFPVAEQNRLIARLHVRRMANPQCLQPENRQPSN